jgi:hypothetical protein
MGNFVAMSFSMSGMFDGNKANLIAPGGTFNKNGNYTVVLSDFFISDTLWYQNSVQFTNGNATISYSSMSSVTEP